MKTTIFTGVATALYTPITDDKINYEELNENILSQIESGISAIVLLGTTGEAPTVTDEEREKIIEIGIKYKKRIKIIIGCGSNCTKKARELARQAKDLGADGVLSVTPYYNKCSQEGLFEHYNEISKENIPFILYNVPSRTGVNAEPETILRISRLESFAGVKEASTDKYQIKKLFAVSNGDFDVYSGNDRLNGFFSSLDASGYISTLSNVIPLKIVDYFKDFKKYYNGENKDVLSPFYDCLDKEINPVAIKAIAEILGKKGAELRLPLIHATKENRNFFYRVLKENDII
ncbi:MAG: 4-hydroxy-tetrahydrodipicolinate synthase [Clostridia bacterium]|nr:4-hydroxy-tetrahydrodipicolinate synthase [Clostridia bacterium]